MKESIHRNSESQSLDSSRRHTFILGAHLINSVISRISCESNKEKVSWGKQMGCLSLKTFIKEWHHQDPESHCNKNFDLRLDSEVILLERSWYELGLSYRSGGDHGFRVLSSSL